MKVDLGFKDHERDQVTLMYWQGFVAIWVDRLGPLRHIFGFESATKMIGRV